MAFIGIDLGTSNSAAAVLRGIPKIKVTFDIDSNGILSVSAKDSAGGKSQSISITGSVRLSESDKAPRCWMPSTRKTNDAPISARRNLRDPWTPAFPSRLSGK